MKPRQAFVGALVLLALGTTAAHLPPLLAQARGGPPPAGQPGQGQGRQGRGGRGNTPTFPGPPAGMQALPIDLFTSKNFYKDQALWLDQRYFRCNTPRQMTDIWTSGRIGDKPPASASWGACNEDYPREKILSAYPYKTAREHYEALLAQAKATGGPTVHSRQTMPDWDGWYARMPEDAGSQWIWGTINQVPTILSLLTPEYQRRMVQMNYHEGVNNAPQWNASFCYPEGYMRWWAQASGGGNFQLTVGPAQVQFLSGVAANFLRQVLIGRSHVQKVPQWYGETIGFWNGTTLVSWTANVQGWTLSHSMFEFSDALETVDVFTPRFDNGGAFVGLSLDTTFYDPRAFLAPVHNVMRFNRTAPLDDPNRRYTYIECLSNLRNTNGRPTQTTAADPRFVDYYGRPWAQNWEKYLEVGWEKPETDLPAEILDLIKHLEEKK